MKFTIQTQEFLKGLTIAYKALSKTNIISPIYSTFKLEVGENRLYITGSNGDLSILTIIPFFKKDKQVVRDVVKGGVLVKAEKLFRIISNIEDTEVTFKVLVDKIVEISTKASLYTLNSIDVGEYPNKDFSLTGTLVKLKGKMFVEAVNQVSFCVSTKQTSISRAVLTGVNLESDTNNIIFTATDGARLAQTNLSSSSKEAFNITVPVKTINDAASIVDEDDDVEIYVDAKRICFKLENTVIISSLIDGSYPNTTNIIPKTFGYSLEVNSNDFLNVLNRVTAISDETDAPVQLELDPWKVVVSSKANIQDSNTPFAKEELSTFKFTGEKLKMTFNSTFVKSAIRALKSKEVTLNFVGEMKPFTVAIKDDNSIVQLITPLRSF